MANTDDSVNATLGDDPIHDDVVEEASRMLLSEDGPFGDVTKQVIASEHRHTRWLVSERVKLQTRLDSNTEFEWSVEAQDFVAGGPMSKRTRSNLSEAIARIDAQLAARQDVSEVGVRTGIFGGSPVDPQLQKVRVEFERGELCLRANYAVECLGVLVGYEDLDAAMAAFEATKQCLIDGETIRLVSLDPIQSYTVPKAVKTVLDCLHGVENSLDEEGGCNAIHTKD